MPLTAEQVGQLTEAYTTDIDARWIMSYAHGICDDNPLYTDTAARIARRAGQGRLAALERTLKVSG